VTVSKEFLVRAAARNNAEWCEAMCRSHGLTGAFGPQAWTAAVRTPLYYPDAVTLTPAADAAALVDAIDTAAPGASVKDSFADCHLTGSGFGVLFDAQWIWRPAGPPAVSSDLEWDVVSDPAQLREWALAWDGGDGSADLFGPALLEDAATSVLAGRTADGRVVAGAVASRSDQVVGVSNVFALDGEGDAAWPGVLAALHGLFPAVPVVGYEQGEDLEAAARHGFEPMGSLRVWMQGI
jgi:hypothetical protein